MKYLVLLVLSVIALYLTIGRDFTNFGERDVPQEQACSIDNRVDYP